MSKPDYPIFANLIFPFMTGGLVVAGIKNASLFGNTGVAIASILGGIPIGIISIMMLKDSAVPQYVPKYFIMNLILAISTALFYMIYTHVNIGKDWIVLITLAVWAVMAIIVFFVTKFAFAKQICK